MSVSVGTFIALFRLVQDITRTNHKSELEQGNNFLMHGQQNNTQVNFDQAISCFAKINDGDMKYARCMAYYGLIVCYAAKCRILVQQGMYSDAKQELQRGRPYIGLIANIDTTIFTLKRRYVKEIKSLVPQIKVEYDMLESMMSPLDLFFNSNSMLSQYNNGDLTLGNSLLRQALQFDNNSVANLDNAIQYFRRINGNDYKYQCCNAYYGIAVSCALKCRLLMISGNRSAANEAYHNGLPYIDMIRNINTTILTRESEYIEHVKTLLPDIRNDYQYLVNYR